MPLDPLLPRNASVFIIRCQDDSALPVLIVDDMDGTPRIVPEVVTFMQALLARGESLAKMRGIATTLALLYDFMLCVQGTDPVTPEKLPEIVAGFLRKRRNGTSESDTLTWSAVKRETVERDRHYLRLFSEFCAQRFGHFPLVPLRAVCPFDEGGTSFKEIMRYLSRKSHMLLAHVAGTRSSFAGRPAIGLKEAVAHRRSNGRTFMSPSLIEDLILTTPSITQRIVFIMAAFGGPRVSEILNMWRCDILPGRYRPVLFPDDKACDIPLVVLAHPSQSRYIGETQPGSVDRLQHLYQAYHRQPRNLLEADSLKAGWKGMLFDNDALLISQLFWADRSWACICYELFQQLRDKVLPLVGVTVRRSHPYLIINDSPSREEFGQPMKISNIRKAFARACERIGVDESRFHEGVHGLRHSYKAMLEKIGLSPEEVRKAMHHVSVVSQQSYGQSSARLNERLTAMLENRSPA